MAKKTRKSAPRQSSELTLQLGSQYLCHANIDVPDSPEVFRNLQGPPHLHLLVDVNLRRASEEEAIYELRLSLRGYGYPHMPKENEQLPTLYQASIIYAGVFGLSGHATQKEQETYLVQEATGYLLPSARSILLTLIRESGFMTANPQPINFREFWHTGQNDGQKETQS